MVNFLQKKSSKHNLTWSESVDEALCFGWIDSTKKTIDHESYKQYFTKRKPQSNWSKVNKDKVKNLTAQGLMQKSGLQSVAKAKENGSWTFLDAVEQLLVPEDLKKALMAIDGASAYFNDLSNSDKKILLYWIISAKRQVTRDKRVSEILENAAKKVKPKQFR